jgi:hypothetical protein
MAAPLPPTPVLCTTPGSKRHVSDRLSQAMAAAIFCGIGSHLGRARSQNAAGHILGHVRDKGADPNDPNTRIYQTAARQTFHTDSADAVGLLCLREAMEGGDSLLVSVETIYNRMRAARPDLLARFCSIRLRPTGGAKCPRA